jgi:hypothetical protein
MITSIKVRKPFLVIRISIHCRMWWGNRWETFVWTCVPLSRTIVIIISLSVSWVDIHSLLQRHQNKWIPISSMVWPHWHHDKWATIGCSKPRWVHNAIRKWVEDKQNASVVGWANNQALALGPTHKQKCVPMIFEGGSTRSETNFCSCKWFAKEASS